MAGTLNRRLALYIDGTKPGGPNASLSGKTNNVANPPFSMMQGDTCDLAVFFRSPSTTSQASDYLELEAGCVIAMAGSGPDGTILFAVTSFTLSGTGTDDACYTGSLNLATEAIETALSNLTGEYLDVDIDVEVRNAGNTERVTFRIPARIYPEIYTVSAPTPTPSLTFGLESPSGYVFQLSITDNGELQIARVQ